MTTDEALDTLKGGDAIRVDFGNGNCGIVRLNGLAYDYVCTDGWAAGCTEPICFISSPYITEFLAETTDVTPYYTESIG